MSQVKQTAKQKQNQGIHESKWMKYMNSQNRNKIYKDESTQSITQCVLSSFVKIIFITVGLVIKINLWNMKLSGKMKSI